jgi:hypothetical protein
MAFGAQLTSLYTCMLDITVPHDRREQRHSPPLTALAHSDREMLKGEEAMRADLAALGNRYSLPPQH